MMRSKLRTRLRLTPLSLACCRVVADNVGLEKARAFSSDKFGQLNYVILRD